MKLFKSLNSEVLLQCLICTNSLHSVKESFIITPPPDNTFIYKSSVRWNSVKSIFKIDDPVSVLKLKLKTYLFNKLLLVDVVGSKIISINYKVIYSSEYNFLISSLNLKAKYRIFALALYLKLMNYYTTTETCQQNRETI